MEGSDAVQEQILMCNGSCISLVVSCTRARELLEGHKETLGVEV